MNILHLIIILVNLLSLEIFAKHGIECDDELFYTTYAKVKRKKNGGNLDSLDRTGFLDLTKFVHVLICINGPAVVLHNYAEVQNGTEKVKVFSNGTMKVYEHECISVNKVQNLAQLRENNPNPRLTDDAVISGMRATGIQLIGNKENYTVPQAAFFLDQKSGHVIRPDRAVTDGSFALIGRESFCMQVDKDFDVVLTSKAETDLEACTWTIKNINNRYEKYQDIFRSGRPFSSYEWHTCPTETETVAIIPSNTSALATANVTEVVDHDHFAFIDPHGTGNSDNEQTSTTDPNGVTEGTTTHKPEIMKKYIVQLGNCTKLPVINKTGCADPAPEFNCPLVAQVMTNPGKFLPEKLHWKHDIMELLSEIFLKICEPWSEEMSSHIAFGLLEYYLVLAHENDTSNPPKYRQNQLQAWDFITTDLKICNKHANKPIWFRWNFQHVTGESNFGDKRKKRSIKIKPHRNPKSHKSPQKNTKHHENHRYNRKAYSAKNTFMLGANFPGMLQENADEGVRLTRAIPSINSSASPSINSSANSSTTSSASPSINSSANSSTTSSASPSINSSANSSTTSSASPPTKASANINFAHQIILPVIHKKHHFDGYPIDVHHVNKKNISNLTELFYFDDTSEIEFDLNIAIDIAWKVWATVAGYCNQHYASRESETFPRFYNTFYEDFLQPVEETWKDSADNDLLQGLLGHANSDDGMRWLDTCLEGAYIDSNTDTFRPPRPLLVKGDKAKLQLEVPSSFIDLPLKQYARYHNVPGPVFGMRNG